VNRELASTRTMLKRNEAVTPRTSDAGVTLDVSGPLVLIPDTVADLRTARQRRLRLPVVAGRENHPNENQRAQNNDNLQHFQHSPFQVRMKSRSKAKAVLQRSAIMLAYL